MGNAIYNIGVTLAWNTAMMTATLPLLGHFLAGAPFGVTISDTAPLGAGLGFGTTLAGASSGVGGWRRNVGRYGLGVVGRRNVGAGRLVCGRSGRRHRRHSWRAAAGPQQLTRLPSVRAAAA